MNCEGKGRQNRTADWQLATAKLWLCCSQRYIEDSPGSVRRATCHLKQITKFCLTLRQVALFRLRLWSCLCHYLPRSCPSHALAKLWPDTKRCRRERRCAALSWALQEIIRSVCDSKSTWLLLLLPHMKMVFIKETTTHSRPGSPGRQSEKGEQVAKLCLLSAINNKLMAVKNKQAHSKAIKSECTHFAHNKKIEYI